MDRLTGERVFSSAIAPGCKDDQDRSPVVKFSQTIPSSVDASLMTLYTCSWLTRSFWHYINLSGTAKEIIRPNNEDFGWSGQTLQERNLRSSVIPMFVPGDICYVFP
jgi:hypothetical protein